MLFTFPEDAGWKAERHAPCGVEIGEYCGVARVHRACFSATPGAAPGSVSTPTTYSGPASKASPNERSDGGS